MVYFKRNRLWHVQLMLCLWCWFRATTTFAEWAPMTDVCNLDSHCLNGGRCMPANDVTKFRHCHCQDGFSGPRCSRFCPFDCQNGGYCRVTPQGGASASGIREQTGPYNSDDYMCKCFGHFTGMLCETPYANCGDEERCYNGGRCVVGEDMIHRCTCPNGYEGDSCEIHVAVEPESEVLTDGGKVAITSLAIAVFILGGALVMLARKKRPSKPMKTIVVEEYDDEDDSWDGSYYDREHTSGHIMLNVL